ncbi:TRAP transporter small permease [Pacificimonas flava]|uniref:TRAP transporter small permease protein n=1 Tax=Pacificimonas flava TaxID=1234595 RepID=M2TRN6_9SPHN|nr:TRAP transporter small permease [Pacificimonas flava]EMD84441.1 TRAP-type transport system, small permease component, N-acetylneuraminate transporter [Pacificimonas flava]MBB5279688.1 TRAP-type C4-dicarboxylate transport system permease small subunit [Pacificimonas flava]
MQLFDRITRINDRLASILLWIGGAGLVLMTVIVGWQVFARYVLNASPNWSEQLTLLLMIWYALLAAAAGFQQDFHIRIAALHARLPERGARSLRLVVEALIVAVGLLFIVWGFDLAATVRTHVIPALGLSRFWAYLPLPIAGAFITLFAGTRLLGEILRPGFAAHDEPTAGEQAASDDPEVVPTVRESRASHKPRKPDHPPTRGASRTRRRHEDDI